MSGQTYPRVVDARVVSELGCIASVLHKIATDIRLLSNRKEIEEPFERDQIGSSAMPYKRNPMRCERVCALSRFVWNLVGNAYDTAATQWLERTLDDSANRRMVLPEAFLALDGCLDIMINVAGGLIVNEAMVKKNLMAELPFMVTEAVMMEAVKKGGDRQELHEVIRRHSMEAGRRVKQEGAENDLIERLKAEPLLMGVDIDAMMDPMKHIGLAVEQTERFIAEVVEPMRQHLGDGAGEETELRV
ncbi:MAG: lyase family protein [Phycisphaerales bacterium]